MKKTFMREAIALSIEKMEAGEGGPFGAVVVKDGEVVGRGWNRVTSSNDPTAHAEVMAIRDACKNLDTFELAGCEIYSSCEPCPMCLAAIYWARLDKLYFAAGRKDAADAGFDDEFLYEVFTRLEGERLDSHRLDGNETKCSGNPWLARHSLGDGGKTRELPSEQTLTAEAQKAFDAWKQKEDRTAY